MSSSAADAVTTRDPRDPIIVALDLPDVAQARELVARIGDGARFYKIGYRLGFDQSEAPGLHRTTREVSGLGQSQSGHRGQCV